MLDVAFLDKRQRREKTRPPLSQLSLSLFKNPGTPRNQTTIETVARLEAKRDDVARRAGELRTRE